jgi:hypothetical protein
MQGPPKKHHVDRCAEPLLSAPGAEGDFLESAEILLAP